MWHGTCLRERRPDDQDRERIPQERKGQTMTRDVNTVAELIVARLEVEGVDYIFGIPGEENIPLVGAIPSSTIRFIFGDDGG